jgi:HK97 family phage portal protein
MANIITNTRIALSGWLNPEKKIQENLFDKALLQYIGTGYTAYDHKNKTYIDKGYNLNPDVFAIVSSIARKFSSVPGILKEVKDEKSMRRLKKLYTKSLSPQEYLSKKQLEIKAYAEDSEEIDEPLERPNYYQSETEFKELWETFMLLTGNAYQWILSPSDGLNAGRPMARFLLPSHLVQIVLKPDFNISEMDNPISHYILLLGDCSIRFEREDIIHSKFPNPNYDLAGSHLYGQSPLLSALRDIQLSNTTIDTNNDTMSNSGIFGFVHAGAGATPLIAEQAADIVARMKEMKASKAILGRIAGASAPLGFTKLSVDTENLQPHSFSEAAQKHIANVLGWSTLLLNTEAKWDNYAASMRIAITNRIMPDLKIYEDGLNSQYYPRFKELKNAEVHFDASELAEMQDDMKSMVDWLNIALDNGAITPDEFRIALRYPAKGTPEMEQHYLKTGIVPIEDVAVSDQSIAKAFNLDD